MKPKLLVSISGGETSAMMAYIIWMKHRDEYEIIFVFANTSREREETLVFLHNIEKHWGIPIVWVEAMVHHGTRKSSTHKVVNFETAKRNGEVFEEVISKYGIPNKSFPHCTRELKTNPIKSYAKSLGWKDYKIAIGYRADEPKRINWEKEQTQNHLYILPRLQIRKADVKAFMAKQPFSLGLKEHEGNCKLCYKKSKRKLLTQILEDPKSCDWINAMEIMYGNEAIPANRINKEEKPFRFFRGYESINDLIEESKLPFDLFIEPTYNDLSLFNVDMDEEEECAVVCEPF